MLTPYIEADGNNPLLGLCTRSLGLYDEFVARLLEVSRGGIEYARTGTLEVVNSTTEEVMADGVKYIISLGAIAPGYASNDKRVGHRQQPEWRPRARWPIT
jgi:hypothetical protein